MRSKAISVAAAVILCSWRPAMAAAPAKCQLQLVGEIPVTLADGEILADATVDGRPVRMKIDTGSDLTALFRDAVVKMGIPVQHTAGARIYGVGGESRIEAASVGRFELGGMQVSNAHMAVITAEEGDAAQGILGAQFLTQADIEFDLAHRKIRFFKAIGCTGDQVVYWGAAYGVADWLRESDYGVKVRVKLNGVDTIASLETGAAYSAVSFEGAADAHVDRKIFQGESAGHLVGIGPGQIDYYTHVFDSFAFGDEVIHNAKLNIADMWARSQEIRTGSNLPSRVRDDARMVLGADFFASHRLYISRDQHKVYASYAGGPVFHVARSEAGAP